MNFTGNPIAVQLYTLREECALDFPGTLEKLKAMGYGAVEFAGLHGLQPEQIQETLSALGLKAAGCHLSLSELQQDFEEITRVYVDILKCDYITVPSGPRQYDDDGKSWNTFCHDMREMKRRAEADGVNLAYHNHAFEFENFVGDSTAFEIMFHQNPDRAPFAELDVCWVAAGQHDPVNELRKLNGRVKLVHVKDLDMGNPPEDTEVGSGKLPWPAIYEAAEMAGVKWLIVERDNAKMSALESVKQSLEFLKQKGLEH